MAEIDTTKNVSNPIAKRPIEMNGRGMVLTTIDDLYRFSDMIVKAQMAPKSLDTPAKVMVAVQAGAELGLTPIVALQSIGVINGKAIVYGDAPLGIVRRGGHLESIREWIEGEIGLDLAKTPDAVTAFCAVTRKGQKEAIGRFSVQDARRAGLWKKGGPWSTHPQNMLKFKARYILRDIFGDDLMGFHLEGEIEPEDMPRHVDSKSIPSTAKLIEDPNERSEGHDGIPVREQGQENRPATERQGINQDQRPGIRVGGMDQDQQGGSQVSEFIGEDSQGTGGESSQDGPGPVIPDPDPSILDAAIKNRRSIR